MKEYGGSDGGNAESNAVRFDPGRMCQVCRGVNPFRLSKRKNSGTGPKQWQQISMGG